MNEPTHLLGLTPDIHHNKKNYTCIQSYLVQKTALRMARFEESHLAQWHFLLQVMLL